MIIIDSITYEVPIKVLSRKADMLYRYAERVQNGDLKSELIGVYFNYEVSAGMSANNVEDYAALWLKLTEPVESHTITLPNESGTITYDCYFANIKDEIVRVQGDGTTYFRNLTFSAIARSPARTP